MNTALALVAALFANRWEPGVGAGGGSVGGEVVAVVRPWIGFEVGPLRLSFQAPLRVVLDDNTLRRADWDEAGDFSRLLRFARVGDAVVAGTLADLTLGHGTLVRRYHNGVDDDHARGGVRVRVGAPRDAVAVDAFVDQVLAAPVVGGRVAAGLPGAPWRVAATAVADTGRPVAGSMATLARPDPDAGAVDLDAAARPDAEAKAEWLWGYGLDFTFDFSGPGEGLSLYSDLNGVDGSGPGLHLGARYVWRTPTLHVQAMGEAMRVGAGYDWAVFDTGWLIDRRLGGFTADGSAAWGARGLVEVDWGGAVRVGGEVADAGGETGDGTARTDASAWVHLSWEALILRGYYRARRASAGTDLPAADGNLGAVSASVPFMPGLWIEATMAHTWRPRALDGAYRGVTEVLVMLEMAGRP